MRYLLFFCFIPLFVVAQTQQEDVPVHLREIPISNLSIDLGISQPAGKYGDISRSGLSAGVTYDVYFNKNIGLSSALKHTYNETAFESFRGSSNENESVTSLTTGLIATVTRQRFQIDGFLRAGIGFIDANDGTYKSLNDNKFYNASSIENTSFVTTAGLRFNYYFRRSVQVFFSPQYETTIGKPSNYEILEPGIIPSTIVENRDLNIANFTLSIGVKIALGPTYTNGELRDDTVLDN